jgi:hypothetical protein
MSFHHFYKIRFANWLSLVAVCGLLPAIAHGQAFSLTPYSFLGTGGTVSNGLFTIEGSIGQSDVTLKNPTSGDFTSLGGYWVADFLEEPLQLGELDVALSSTNIQAGQAVSLPIDIASTNSVGSLSLTLEWPTNYFTIPTLTTANPTVSGSIQTSGGNVTVLLQATGAALEGVQQVAALNFSAIPNNLHSAFVPISVSTVTASVGSGLLYSNIVVHTATVTVIEDGPLLAAAIAPDGSRTLSLYGWLGANYVLQSSIDLASPESWVTISSYTQSSGILTLTPPTTGDAAFYRIIQQ